MTTQDPTANPDIIKRLENFHDESAFLLNDLSQTMALITNDGEPTWTDPKQVIDILLGIEVKLKTLYMLCMGLSFQQ